MAQQVLNTIENNFSGGLKTEFTGLNFPENACTDTDNCVFSIIGDVSRRMGIDFENDYKITQIVKTASAINSYKWNNVGGDGNTKIYVVQVGVNLHFYRSTDATLVLPLSHTKLISAINIGSFATGGSIADIECQFASGNGYLFVFHPNADPFYCTYSAGTITATSIQIKIRDFSGIPEAIATNYRPAVLNNQHGYNLLNQGWRSNPAWSATSTTAVTIGSGSKTFTVGAGLPIVAGTQVTASTTTLGQAGVVTMSGTVTSYAGTTLVLNITTFNSIVGMTSASSWVIVPVNAGLITAWNTAEGNYPSNADVWWRFKNNSNVFDPATTQPNVTVGSGFAQRGFYILDAFNQQRGAASGLTGAAGELTPIVTNARPKTGTWFQGRVWYAGVDASQQAVGDQNYYTWTETIYFSQVIENQAEFGMCYQTNDPTDQDFFDELPTDGGTITIQDSGTILKLFPIQNGLLVFGGNGIWFITGSQGIGFAANDYTVTKISSVQAMSASSFVDVLGFPVFWNEEGIYSVAPAPQGGGLVVNNLCWGTILSFYADIPSSSKKYARGDYDPVNFVVSWTYKSTPEVSISDRYKFDRVLNFNTSNKCFYPYTIATENAGPYLHDVKYIYNPGGSSSSSPSGFKYLVSSGDINFTFAEEHSEAWKDFVSYNGTGFDYDSYFVTGYKLHGQGIRKYQPIYIQVFSDAARATAYKIQAIWDYANDRNSGRYSAVQMITNALSRFGIMYRRHKLRGRGLALQFKIASVAGMPFSIMGWTGMEAHNTGM